jgi:outer membrane lipoprotein-sorting protein
MRIQCVLAGIICAILVMTGCQSTTQQEDIDGILAKMKKETDPKGRGGSISTQVVTSDVKNADGQNTKLVVKIKFPDKIRIEADTADGIFIKACNGSKGWEFSTRGGVREITGKELAGLKFQAEYLSVKKVFKEIFSSIVLEGDELVNEKPCFKLICTPMPEYCSEPITVYIDKGTYQIVKTEECHNTQNGKLYMDRFFLDRRNIDGINFPMTIISLVKEKIIEMNVKSLEWNKPLHDSEFNMPEQLDKQ